MFVIHANGSQLDLSNNNQVLSSIYSEYNNDYLTWEKLPNFNHSTSSETNILSNIIIDKNNYSLENLNEDNFIIELLAQLDGLKSNNCNQKTINKANYIFEESLSYSIDFWKTHCKKKANIKLLENIDNRFKNISIINQLYFHFILDNKNQINLIHKKTAYDGKLLSLLNSKELNLINKIFLSNNLEFPLNEIVGSPFSMNGFKIDLDSNFYIDNYLDLIYLQTYQTSIYYFYAKEYKKALALLSFLSRNNKKNFQFYEYKKISFIAELTPNNNSLDLIKEFEIKNEKFQFFIDHLYLKTASEFNFGNKEINSYFHNLKISNDWQFLELAMIVSMNLYRQNENKKALNFLEKCCLKILEISKDPIHLFKYGILLERNNFIKKSEKIIQLSIDISEGSYPYILNYLAYLWVDNNRNLDVAEEMLTQAVEDSDYQDGAILDSLGWLYFKKNQIDLAEKWILQAYKMEPAEPEIIDHLSQIYTELGRKKEASFLDNKIILFHKDYFRYEEVLNRN
tara:strand:- start:295 stop:1830 length:1536 start_codon:yes stop_codon:yes gene_type:complete